MKFPSLYTVGASALLACVACASLKAATATDAATPAPYTNAVGQTIAPELDPKLPPGTSVYNIRDYGATGDGKTIDSDAVNRAIDAAAANGGGTVFFPAGYYLCYSIHLKTNITLFLSQGSWIVAAETPSAVVALQRGGNRGGAGGPGGTAGGARGPGARGTTPPAPPRLRGDVAAAATPAPAAAPDAGAANQQAAAEPQAIQDFLARVPAGTKMYDVIENNIWSNLPGWRRPDNAGQITPGQDPIVNQQYQDFGHCFWHNSLIWGDSITNVSILGPGTIFGRGLSRGDGANNLGGGNKSISLVNCRNVVLKDFTVKQGGWFCLLATGVDNFTISNIKVDTNRDGFDIDCCKNVHISDCFINSPQDDGIVLKSTYALGYARSTDNVTITNCQVSGFNEGTFLDGTYQVSSGRGGDGGGSGTGRIKFGTESNGGFKNITISNCVFTHCRGLALEAVDGAIIEDVSINNITMQSIVNSPIYIRLGRRLRGPANTTVEGAIRRVNISNVIVSNAVSGSSIIIAGTPDHPVQDVHLNNIRILYQGTGTKEMAQIEPPEDELQGGRLTYYPEPSNLGTMPAYGIFVRHASGLTLSDVDVSYAAPDFRPAVIMDDVQGVEFDHFKAQLESGIPEFMLWNTRDFSVTRSPGVTDQHLDKVDNGGGTK